MKAEVEPSRSISILNWEMREGRQIMESIYLQLTHTVRKQCNDKDPIQSQSIPPSLVRRWTYFSMFVRTYVASVTYNPTGVFWRSYWPGLALVLFGHHKNSLVMISTGVRTTHRKHQWLVEFPVISLKGIKNSRACNKSVLINE